MIKDELTELFFEMADHLEYCGYGDKWEREGARMTKLPERVETMRKRLESGEMYALGENKDEMTTTVAAGYLGVSRPTLMKYIKEGKLEAHKVGRHHRVKKTDLERFAEKRREEQHQALQELWKLEEEYGIRE